MDASIIVGSIGVLWALWYFVVSGFIPPRKCPVLTGMAAAFRRDKLANDVRAARAAYRRAVDDLAAAMRAGDEVRIVACWQRQDETADEIRRSVEAYNAAT